MKKVIILLCVFVFSFVFYTPEAFSAGVIASDVQCPSPCIDSSEIVDGTVTSADIADGTITGTDIQDNSVGSADITDGSVTSIDIADGTVDTVDLAAGAVTDAKITGPISRANLEKASNRVVVAISGGDYATITAALAAITPSASTPYVIDVMPGTYVDCIDMKSNVHLRGAGKEVTIIDGAACGSVISLWNVDDAAISGLTVSNGNYGIGSGPFTNITISENIFKTNSFGMYPGSGSNMTIRDSYFTENNYGIVLESVSGFTISGNILIGNGYGTATYDAIHVYDSSGTISGNLITENGNGVNASSYSDVTLIGNTITRHIGSGIDIAKPTLAMVINNRVTGNNTGGSLYFMDI
ncbi:MAG: right-handed parallel beta-helix repeat-containing protein, partial [Deltaproteobacteria bacterium]|nr:right-handed parallel beta-helix repeat-containing protein [Deltaproteobacteria bacterium]